MSKGEELAAAFEKTNTTAIQALEDLQAGSLQKTTSEEGWTVAATARHFAGSQETILGLVQSIIGAVGDATELPTTVKIRLNSTAGTGHFYVTKKNSRTMTEKMSVRKYDPVARKHVEYKEGKIK